MLASILLCCVSSSVSWHKYFIFEFYESYDSHILGFTSVYDIEFSWEEVWPTSFLLLREGIFYKNKLWDFFLVRKKAPIGVVYPLIQNQKGYKM